MTAAQLVSLLSVFGARPVRIAISGHPEVVSVKEHEGIVWLEVAVTEKPTREKGKR